MATKRMIKSNLPKSKKMRRLRDDTTRLLFYMLCVSCDDEGKMDAEPEDVRADLFGGRDEIKIEDVKSMLIGLSEVGLIVFYQDNTTAEVYLQIPKWKEVNVIPPKRVQKSVIPSYSRDKHSIVNICLDDVNECTQRVVEVSIEESSIEEDSLVLLSGKPDYEEIINDLNFKAGTDFRATTKKTKDAINARINEGFTVEDFLIVHTKKVKDWKNNKEYVKFLRPITLYGNKFEGYLNQQEPEDGVDEWLAIREEKNEQ